MKIQHNEFSSNRGIFEDIDYSKMLKGQKSSSDDFQVEPSFFNEIGKGKEMDNKVTRRFTNI